MSEETTKMPDEIKEVFKWLENEMLWIHEKWDTFRELYRSKAEIIDALNCFSGRFFMLCQATFGQDVILSLCRIDDSSVSCGQTNLSLSHLIDVIKREGDSELAEALGPMREGVKSAVAPLRRFRNKIISHNDLDIRLRRESQSLGVEYTEIDAAVEKVEAFLNQVLMHYEGTERSYALGGPGGTDEFLYNLRCWWEHRQDNDERLPPHDWRE